MKICRALLGFVVALLCSPHSSVARLCDKDNKSVWIMSTIGAQAVERKQRGGGGAGSGCYPCVELFLVLMTLCVGAV